MKKKNRLPLIPIKDTVLFPGTIAPLFIGRQKSINALSWIEKNDNNYNVLVTTQKNLEDEDPNASDLYDVGLIVKVIQTVKLPNNKSRVIIKVEERVSISKIVQEDGYLSGEYSLLPDKLIDDIKEINDLVAELFIKFTDYIKSNKKISQDVLTSISPDQKNPGHIINVLSSHLISKISVKQRILEIRDIKDRAVELLSLITKESQMIATDRDIESKLEKQMKKKQREYYLHEKMQIIQKELGDTDKEVNEIEKKIKKLNISKEAREKIESEFKKLKVLNQASAEFGVIRTYVDTFLSMPWGKMDKSEVDIKKSIDVLNDHHYGLEKVKDRIIEYLSVLQRSKKIKGPILCFVGPPGVGKTSLVKSIAESISRKYGKFSLGGVRDEAEIRGHRKTYIGAMPGKIISTIKKLKVDNPVILLDEIDKMSSDFRGDPSSALLEVLDPEQNSRFTDNYLEVEYDLSNVMFIATANSLNIPRPLLDRMEIIRLHGYIEDEKLQIAKSHLVPKQLKNHNIKPKEIVIDDDSIKNLTRYYTRESGVRDLERQISSIIRKALRNILENKSKKIAVSPDSIESYLGIRKYKIGLAEKEDTIGATTGLAYTEVGGDLLVIEALALKGKGEVKATGKLGDVMKESSQAAYSCFCANAEKFGISYEMYKDKDIHIHVPEGAVPKDGPSAGITIFTTIVSLLTGIPVRKDVAMTGEITLRGRVLAIGGLREKLLAALRGGIKTVIIPEDNIPDLKDIPLSITNNLEIIPVSEAMSVVEKALVRNPFVNLQNQTINAITSNINVESPSQYS